MGSLSEKLESIRSKITMIEEEKQDFYNFIDKWPKEKISHDPIKYQELKVRIKYAEKLNDARFSIQLEAVESNVRFIFEEDVNKYKQEKERLFEYLAKAYDVIDYVDAVKKMVKSSLH